LVWKTIVQIVPIVQPVVIACIIEDGRRGDLQGDTHYDSSRPTNSASLMWATFGLFFFDDLFPANDKIVSPPH
jgi:hypothetical protein